MKLLHTADIHIGMVNYSKLDPETGLESRLLDFFKTFDYIVDRAIEEKVDAFIFAGDAYKTRDPSPTQQRGFGERITRLAKAQIPVVMVVGNHDTPNAEGKANTLDIYSALEIPNVWVSRKPEFLNIPTKSGNLQVITAPWLHKSDFKTLGNKLNSMYEKINPNPPAGPGSIGVGGPAILVGHLEVSGASMGSEKGLALVNDAAIPLSLLTDRRLDYVALGHIHKHQVLNEKPPVVYCSSPERIDFSEEKEERGFMMVEIPEHGEVFYRFEPTKARRFLTISVRLKPDDQNPTQTILQEIEKQQITEAVVRVLIDIPADLNKEIEMDKIKKALAPAHFIAGISRNVERKEREKIDGIEEAGRLTPAEALHKYFESKKFSHERIKQLEVYASKLLDD